MTTPQSCPRILVTDDERPLLSLYQRILGPRPAGNTPSGGAGTLAFDVVSCSQGEEAIEAARTALAAGTPFSVAFIDIRMPPGIDGITTAKVLREMDPHLQIVMVSGHADVTPLEISQSVPPPDKLLFLQKPFSAHEIRQCTLALASKWSAERELQEMNEALERRVEERTAELAAAYADLQKQEAERKRTRDALRESEEKFRNIVQSSPMGIYLYQVDRQNRLRLLDVNPAAQRMTGFDDRTLIGKTIAEAFPALEDTNIPEAYLRAALDGISYFNPEFNYRVGEIDCTFEIHAFQTSPGRMAVIFTDVTQRKLAQAELARAKESAESASRAKSQFLANISHEIRTPMTAIIGFAEVLLESGNLDKAPPQRIEAAETIKRNSEYLVGIINDILDLSKIEAGKMTVENLEVDPCQVIAEVASLVRVRADAKGLPLEIEYEGSLPRRIQTDPTRLRQILVNVIGNAIKFTEVGHVRLITRLVDRDTTPMLEFDIVDTGIGMSPDQADRLFVPFSQADNSTTRRFGGTGLGLTISKRLTAMLGGDVFLVSTTPGTGTCFRVRIATGPLDQVEWNDDPRSAVVLSSDKATPTSASVEAPLEGRHILFAEDGPDNRRLISYVLEKVGATLTVVENGRLAVEAAVSAQAAGKTFDCILMDMQMPEVDGYEATIALRQMGFDLPIIALTAHAMATDRQKCIDAGCDDYASKPIDRANLIEVIQRHIEAARHQAESHSSSGH